MAYILNTPDEVAAMLASIGVDSIENLFAGVPAELRLDRPLQVSRALSELELTSHIKALAGRNRSCEEMVCFLGGGAYDHFIPAVVDQLASRGEFYTAYTPYQAEASQGTLQAIFEYQSLVAQLTGLDVSNASLYDGGSAVAEAVMMAIAVTGRDRRVVVADTVHPEYRQTLRTYLANLPPEIVTVAHESGRVDPAEITRAIDSDTAAVVLQYPNFFGQLEDVAALVEAVHAAGALAIVSFDPISLGILRRPGDYGADIAVAEGQCLGNPLHYGGPYLGLMACREQFVRKMPGRIVGQTTDRRGNRCWVLTLQTREQHIRRDKATSNICTNQGLFALRASIYLAVMGVEGLRTAAERSTVLAHQAADRLSQLEGFELALDGPFFKEFVLRCDQDPAALVARLEDDGILAGVPLAPWYPEMADCLLVALTEKRTPQEIEGLAVALQSARASLCLSEA